MKTFYINRLPHIVPLGGCFFVTFCTHDSIPIHKNLGKKRDCFLEEFKTWDRRHDLSDGLINLTWPPLAAIVQSAIERHDQDLYDLLYYSYFQFLPFPSAIHSRAVCIRELRVVSVLAPVIHSMYSLRKE